jgi:hypothetical protein
MNMRGCPVLQLSETFSKLRQTMPRKNFLIMARARKDIGREPCRLLIGWNCFRDDDCQEYREIAIRQPLSQQTILHILQSVPTSTTYHAAYIPSRSFDALVIIEAYYPSFF